MGMKRGSNDLVKWMPGLLDGSAKSFHRLLTGLECDIYCWVAEEVYGDYKFAPPDIYNKLKPIILERMGENE